MSAPPSLFPSCSFEITEQSGFALEEILKAYDTFGNAAKHEARKVVWKT